MRCLYCGNELALLKKLTGHGEFCSEAHRQKYQEQYNRLALARLLHAQEPENERRPLQTARPGSRQRSEVEAGAELKRVEAAPSGAQANVDEPELEGFLPHQFEPALYPAELFSSEPFLAPVTACLPGSVGRPGPVAALNSFGSSAGRGGPAPSSAGPKSLPQAFASRPKLLNGIGIPLALQPTTDSPRMEDAPLAFDFDAEYRSTLTAVLEPILADDVRGAAARDAGTSRTEADRPPAATETPGFKDGSDGFVFERAHEGDTREPSVVINFGALTGSPEKVRPAQLVSVVVSDDEEIRRLLGLFVEDAKDRVETPATIEPDVQVSPPLVTEPAVIKLEITGEGGEAGPLTEEFLRPDHQVGSSETAQSETKPVSEQPPIMEAVAVETAVASAVPEAVNGVPTVAEPVFDPAQETAPPAPIPVAHERFVDVTLRLADGSFGPANDAEFADPQFTVQTPPVISVPLRSKIVFGPSPGMAAAPTSHVLRDDAAPAESRSSDEELDRLLNPRPSQPVRPEPASAEQTRSSHGARRTEDRVPAAPGVDQATAAETPAETAARLRALARKARIAEPVAPSPPTSEPAQPPASVPPPPQQSVKPPAPDIEALRLEMERMSVPVDSPSVRYHRIAVAIALVLAIVLVGYLLKEAFAAKPATRTPQTRLEPYGPSLVSGATGWSMDWAGNRNSAFPQRRIYIFQPSLSMSDYRIEFKGQIESKALGWIFRAANPRNYYAMKLEMVKAGLSPQVVLTRTAVINGEETQKSRAELPMRVALDTVYEVRTDVWGSTFKTYIQDQLVDTWVDDRLKIGGFGLVSDKDEQAQVRLIQLYGLRLVSP